MQRASRLLTVLLCFFLSCKDKENPMPIKPNPEPPVEPTPVNRNPSIVILVAPQSGAENTSPMISFQWSTATDPDGDEVIYELYVGTEDNPSELLYSGARTSLRPMQRFSLHEKYKWKVIAKDGKGGSSESKIESFNTRGIFFTQKTPTATFSPRIHGSILSYDNKLWMIGGSSQYDGTQRLNEVWSSGDGSTWKLVSNDLSFNGRVFHAAVTFKNKMWVIGGLSNTALENDVWSSEDGKTWTQVTSAAGFSARSMHKAVVFDNKIWVIGGWPFKKNDVWFSEDGESWTRTTEHGWDWDFAVFDFSVVAFNNKLWIFGMETIWTSTDGIEWKKELTAQEFQPLLSRYNHICTAYDNKLWIVGGSSLSFGPLKDAWYTTDGSNWYEATSAIPFPPRFKAHVTVFESKLWIMGGYNQGILNDVWYID